MAVTIDNLQIEIQSQSTKATSSLMRLIDTLKDLKTACAGGAGLGTLVNQLERLNKTLAGQSPSDSLDKVSRAAKRAAEGVKDYAASLREATKAQKDMVNNAMGRYNSGSGSSGNNGLNTYNGGIPSQLGGSSQPLLTSYIDADYKEITATGEAISGLADAMNEVKDTTPFMKTALGEVNQGNIDMLKSTLALQSPLGKLASHFANLSKKAKSSGHSVSSLFAALKRIAMYRLLRTALKEIGEAFSEGLSNAYQYSKIVGTELAPALDHLASVNLKMKNQLGALAGQLLIAVMPLLTRLIDFVTKLADRLTEVMAALNGNPTYQKAKDISTVWEDATDAVKEYKQQLLGLDELNVLSTNGSNGGKFVSPIGDMFAPAPIDENLRWLGKFKLNFDDLLFNWDNFDPTDKILAGTLGLFAGIAGFALTGSALTALGAAVGGIALGALFKTLYFDKDVEFTAENEAWKEQIVKVIGETVALGGLGALLGFAVGGPGGAVYGAKIGVGLSALIQSIRFVRDANLQKSAPEAIGEIANVGTETIPNGIKFTPDGNNLNLSVGGGLDCHINDLHFRRDSKLNKNPSEAIKEITDVSTQAIPKGITFEAYSNSVNMSVGASVDYRINKINMKKGNEFEVTGASIITDSVNDAVKGVKTSPSQPVTPSFTVPEHLTSTSPVNGSGIDKGSLDVKAGDVTLTDFATSAYGIALEGGALGAVLGTVGGATAAKLALHKAGTAAGTVGAEIIEFSDILKKVNGLANGGIPTQGTLFYAGESGPEFVGNMGGRSAVANTDQMSEAIEMAAYRGVSRAMQENNNTVVLSPDADKIFNITREKGREYTRMTGQSWAY